MAAGGTDLQVERPRGAVQLVGLTFDLYRRFPLLFLALAAAVLVPYELFVLLVTHTGSLGGGRGWALGLVVGLTDLALVLPLISALHVHAVSDVRNGKRPELGPVARRGLATLSAVSPVVVISWLGIIAGLVALVVPGILLWLRWSVAAQLAALQGGGWKVALRRSAGLAEGNYLHIFGLFLLVQVISFVPSFAVGRAFAHTDTTVVSFLVGLALQIVLRSFSALTTALLFFDLSARFKDAEIKPATDPTLPPHLSGPTPHPSPSSVDPGRYGDEDRPPGWYVNPDKPWRMRYWGEDGEPGWSRRTRKTPKGTLAEWKDLRWAREKKST
jgi:hypothetical protein